MSEYINRLGGLAILAASGTAELGTLEIKNVRTFVITLRGTYNASGTLPLRLNLYYSPDGKNWDTIPFAFFDLDLTAGSACQETHLIDCPENGMISVKVQNTDTVYTETNISVWSSLARWAEGATQDEV